MHRKHHGARGEMMACIWLLNNGYEVFRNISAHGEIDLVAIKDQEILKLDVKSSIKLDKGARFLLKDSQVKNGVVPIYVFSNGECRIDYQPCSGLGDASCKQCFTKFRLTRLKQKYCSVACRVDHARLAKVKPL